MNKNEIATVRLQLDTMRGQRRNRPRPLRAGSSAVTNFSEKAAGRPARTGQRKQAFGVLADYYGKKQQQHYDRAHDLVEQHGKLEPHNIERLEQERD
jgi:hypothetical protein